jgi:hypothetical protein
VLKESSFFGGIVNDDDITGVAFGVNEIVETGNGCGVDFSTGDSIISHEDEDDTDSSIFNTLNDGTGDRADRGYGGLTDDSVDDTSVAGESSCQINRALCDSVCFGASICKLWSEGGAKNGTRNTKTVLTISIQMYSILPGSIL